MLRDKLAESETKELEDCLAEHVLRESLYEHVKTRLDSPVCAQFWMCLLHNAHALLA